MMTRENFSKKHTNRKKVKLAATLFAAWLYDQKRTISRNDPLAEFYPDLTVEPHESQKS